jgi:hypothetical protein
MQHGALRGYLPPPFLPSSRVYKKAQRSLDYRWFQREPLLLNEYYYPLFGEQTVLLTPLKSQVQRSQDQGPKPSLALPLPPTTTTMKQMKTNSLARGYQAPPSPKPIPKSGLTLTPRTQILNPIATIRM